MALPAGVYVLGTKLCSVVRHLTSIHLNMPALQVTDISIGRGQIRPTSYVCYRHLASIAAGRPRSSRAILSSIRTGLSQGNLEVLKLLERRCRHTRCRRTQHVPATLTPPLSVRTRRSALRRDRDARARRLPCTIAPLHHHGHIDDGDKGPGAPGGTYLVPACVACARCLACVRRSCGSKCRPRQYQHLGASGSASPLRPQKVPWSPRPAP
ncbi:hypothetical protein BV20DRAFT_754780 [Pilatotrama ljubarskyi]|nr:hypothetical protein BV20DRAFT_754780 [Pilatotrama ljubarskyi]